DLREQKNPDFEEIFVVEETEYGVRFEIDPSLYGNDDSASERIGFIPRLRQDWNAKDGGDRAWMPSLGNEIWLIGNDPKIYTSQPDIAPRITFAKIDTPKRINLAFSHPVAVAQVKDLGFSLVDENGK